MAYHWILKKYADVAIAIVRNATMRKEVEENQLSDESLSLKKYFWMAANNNVV